MITNFRALFWNCQGCGHPYFCSILKEYRRDYNLDLVALYETRISGARANSVVSKIGFEYSFRVEATGFASCIWIFWNGNIGVNVLRIHGQYIHMRNHYNSGSTPFLYTIIYGSLQRRNRERLWSELEVMSFDIVEPWLLTGDFNSILNYIEHLGGTVVRNTSCNQINSFVFSTGLNDLRF